MTINTRELIEAVSVVTENHNIRVTVKSSLRASAIVAGTTFAGAVVRNPDIAKFFPCALNIYSNSYWDQSEFSLDLLEAEYTRI